MWIHHGEDVDGSAGYAGEEVSRLMLEKDIRCILVPDG
jgi:hypothetical protein